MNIFELDESLRTENPCWKGYHPVGTKKKNGRTVPNCVPESEQGVAEGSEKLSYIGNCTDDDVIEYIFGDATNFAQAVEEHGDEFTIDDLVVKYDPETDVHSFYYKKQGVAEGSEQQLTVQQLATISDEALDKAYGYGRSTPGNSFGWQANLMSAAYAKKMIDAGVTDIEKISDAIHKGWNVTAQKFVQNPDQFGDTEKLRQAGKLEAKLAQRSKLMKINYAQLDNEEQEKDRVVARALLQAIKGQQGVAEAKSPEEFLGQIRQMATPKQSPQYSKFDELYDRIEVALMSAGVITDDLEYDIERALKSLKVNPKPSLVDKLVQELHNRQSRALDHYDDPWGERGVAEGAIDNASPMTRDSVKADRIRSLKNLIAIARKQGRQLRVQELELELKKLEGVAEDWQKVNKQDKTDGMSKKAVKAYRRENPGSKLQTAVTKKPSELKAGSKDAKRRKSFCARMSGVEGPMKDEHGKPTPKAKALKRWNCREDVNEDIGTIPLRFADGTTSIMRVAGADNPIKSVLQYLIRSKDFEQLKKLVSIGGKDVRQIIAKLFPGDTISLESTQGIVEDVDQEFQNFKSHIRHQYPGSKDENEAFMRYVFHELEHESVVDDSQSSRIERMELDLQDIMKTLSHISQEHRALAKSASYQESTDNPTDKVAGRHQPEDFDAMVQRVGQRAKQGPLKTVWDPVKRVYKNVPRNQSNT